MMLQQFLLVWLPIVKMAFEELINLKPTHPIQDVNTDGN